MPPVTGLEVKQGRVKTGEEGERILNELKNERWVMEERALGAFFDNLINISDEASPTIEAQEIRDKPFVIRNGEGIIKIEGVLLKTVPAILRWFGIAATGYDEIIEGVSKALKSKEVKRILLEVDSPGGTVAGIDEASAAIFNARKVKPVGAVVNGDSASGGYWLTAQAEKIRATRNSIIGSIGAYTVVIDSKEAYEKAGYKVNVIRSGNLKGMGIPGTEASEEQLEAFQEVIDEIAKNFMQSVAKGRGMNISEIKKLATGRVWLAPQAKKLELIDEVVTGSNQNKKLVRVRSIIMPENTIIENDIDLEAETTKARAEGIELERQRFKDLEAAFPDEAKFVAEQFKAGNSVEKAKGEFAEVLKIRLQETEKEKEELEEKNEELQEKNEELEKKEGGDNPSDEGGDGGDGGGVEGAAPVKHGEAGSGGGKNFITISRELAKEKNISLGDAMSIVSKEQPELFKAYKESCGKVKK